MEVLNYLGFLKKKKQKNKKLTNPAFAPLEDDAVVCRSMKEPQLALSFHSSEWDEMHR